MMKKNLFLAALAAFCLGCSGGVRKDKIENALHRDPYEFLAERLSAAHDKMANPKVAVLPFSYTDRRESDDGVVVSERLLTRVIQEGRLEVVERNLLEKVMSELKLQYSGIVDEKSIKSLGKILGVEAVITGTLTRRNGGSLEINARLIRAETAVVLAAAAAQAPLDWESWHPGQLPEPAPVPATADAAPAPEPLLVQAAPPDAPLLYLKFDEEREGPGRTLADAGRLGKGAVMVGGASLDPDGARGGGLRLDGRSGYLNLGMSPDAETGDFSYAFWFKTRSQQPAAHIYSNRFTEYGRGYIGDGKLIQVGLDEKGHAGIIYLCCGPNPGPGCSREARAMSLRPGLNDGVWHHLAAVKDRYGLYAYIDGEKTPGHFSGDLGDCSRDEAAKSAGIYSDGQNPPVYFDGSLDELMVFDRALGEAEVKRLYSGRAPDPVAALRFPEAWAYRENLRVAEKSRASLVDYQVLVKFDSAGPIKRGRMKADCSDLRFANSDEKTGLHYWLEGGCGTSETRAWVRLPFLAKNSVKNIYLYYGNPAAASESSGERVFRFFDDFGSASVDQAKWRVLPGQCGVVASNGRLAFPGCGYGHETSRSLLVTRGFFPPPYTVDLEARATALQRNGQYHQFIFRWAGLAGGSYGNPEKAVSVTAFDGFSGGEGREYVVQEDREGGERRELARPAASYVPGALNRYTIKDSGSALKLFCNGSPEGEVSTSYAPGTQMGIAGREYPRGAEAVYTGYRIRGYAEAEPEVSVYRPAGSRGRKFKFTR